MDMLTQDFLYNSNYWYYTMTPKVAGWTVYQIGSDGEVSGSSTAYYSAVRPVIELYKNDGITRKISE